uniref:Lon N-terminal domain-containing protein n=2 Tax=Dunaliella tertiolecta TaxID=3047 RepID=A0A7S3QUL6_DUNTE
MHRKALINLLCLGSSFKDLNLIRRSSSFAPKRWVSARDDAAAFASSTVQLSSPELPSPSSVEHAVKEALASVRQTLGSDCHAFLLTTSLPRPLAASALSSLHLQTQGVPVAGCSSLQWQPMPDLPNAAAKEASSSSAAAATSTAEPSSAPARARVEAEHLRYHITLGGMHVPNADVHAFHTPTSSLPPIPNLAAALSSRPPTFILMGTHEGTVDILKGRLENLFSPGSVACATTGTLQLPSRQTTGGLAVPSGIPGMELWGMKSSSDRGMRWEPRGPSSSSSSSSSSSASSAHLKDAGPMAFLNESILSVGCCGLMLLPRDSTQATTRSNSSSSSSSTSTSSRGKAARQQACLPPASCALLSQSLLGHDRFFSLMISDTAMRYLQPPHTSPRTWQDLRRPHGGPSLAAANAAMHRSKQQQQQQQQLGTGLWVLEEGLPCPPVAALPANVRISGSKEVSCDSRSGSGSASASSLDPSASTSTSSSISNHSSSSSSSSGGGASGSSPKALKTPQRRLPAASSPWSLSSQVNAFGGSGVPHVVNRLLQPIPIVSFGPNFTIFPGEEVQLRIFEKRYQWLIRQAVHQHGCFGIASARGMGTAVVVNRYILNNSDFYIVVEGSSRLLFNPESAAPLPACFGLAAVEDALVVQDQAQLTPAETLSISRTAGQILSLLAAGARVAYTGNVSNEPASNAGLVFLGGLMQQQRALQSGIASDSDSDRSDSDSDEEDEGADGSLQEGQQEHDMLVQAYAQQLERHSLDAASASQFSLMLSAFMPIEVEKRRKFMLTFNSKARLSEQKKHLASFPNVAASAAGTLMGCPPTHPMRQLLGLQDLPPLNQD